MALPSYSQMKTSTGVAQKTSTGVAQKTAADSTSAQKVNVVKTKNITKSSSPDAVKMTAAQKAAKAKARAAKAKKKAGKLARRAAKNLAKSLRSKVKR